VEHALHLAGRAQGVELAPEGVGRRAHAQGRAQGEQAGQRRTEPLDRQVGEVACLKLSRRRIEALRSRQAQRLEHCGRGDGSLAHQAMQGNLDAGLGQQERGQHEIG
jgi:hypothetical protein